MDEITKFTNSKGVPLLGLYSEEDLRSWLTAKIRSGNEDELPEILVITGPTDEKRYIKKRNYYDASVKLLTDARPLIKKALSDRWFAMIKGYRIEPAMKQENEFEKLLRRLVDEIIPDLMTVMTDKKLYLICDEKERETGSLPANARFFIPGGTLLPMSTILLINRKDILTGIRLLLPFWYSIPLFFALAAFFCRLKNGWSTRETEKNFPGGAPARSGSAIKEAGRKLESELVPSGDDIDSSLERLENRWNTLLNSQARQDLLTDVKTLIRDRLRQVLRGQRNVMLTRDSLENIALNIAEQNNTLRDLNDQDNLRQYIVLYMTKLLIQTKF
jgi:hypothetical protein